jgi:hypothetical protein
VSVEAISWALNLAPVPAGRGGQPSSACKFVLVGLANHADPDGGAAFPSVARLVRYTGLSERTVRTCLGRLEAAGIIGPCDPGIVAARIKRADRRPKGWDLDLTQVRGDLTGTEVAALGRQSSSLAARAAAAACSKDGAGPVDNPAGGVQPLRPAPGTGCNQRSGGVQPAQPRGAAAAPEPSREPCPEPPAATARVCEAAPAGGGAPGGGPAGEFFAALGGGWRLSAAQRLKLSPVVTAALEAGWAPSALAAFTAANTSGVRSPYAVLAARLSPAELPAPSGRSARPYWCGECDQTTRMLGFHGDAPRPCPRCKPAAYAPGRARPRRSPPPRSPHVPQASLAARAGSWSCEV